MYPKHHNRTDFAPNARTRARKNGDGISRLAQCRTNKPGAILMRVRFHGTASDFPTFGFAVVVVVVVVGGGGGGGGVVVGVVFVVVVV